MSDFELWRSRTGCAKTARMWDLKLQNDCLLTASLRKTKGIKVRRLKGWTKNHQDNFGGKMLAGNHKRVDVRSETRRDERYQNKTGNKMNKHYKRKEKKRNDKLDG